MEKEERIHNFVDEQQELLKLEKLAHEKREIEERRENGDTLLVEKLSTKVPSYGGTLVVFKARKLKKNVKTPYFRKGCMVGVNIGEDQELLEGIIVNAKLDIYEVHVGDSEEFFKTKKNFELVKLGEFDIFEELHQSLEKIKSIKTDLRNILFRVTAPSDPLLKLEHEQSLEFINRQLDSSQREAVEFALNQRELAVVHGPPGTGKTTTVVEIICQVKHSMSSF